jgi:hypothetical protein
VSVTVKVDTEGCLLSAGQGSRKAAGAVAVQEIVQTLGEPGVVGDSESDLGTHEPTSPPTTTTASVTSPRSRVSRSTRLELPDAPSTPLQAPDALRGSHIPLRNGDLDA